MNLYSTQYYNVDKLEESIPVKQDGITLNFHYSITNNLTDKIETYSQFLPAAIEQAVALDGACRELLKEGGGIGSPKEESADIVKFKA